MSESPPVRGTFRVGEWVVDPDQDRIIRGAEITYLRPQVMALLVYMARHRGRVISSEELLDRLWAGKVVTGGSVYNCVAELRRALSNGSDQPGFVETIPKRGYLLLAPVSGLDGSVEPGGRKFRTAWTIAAGVAAAALAVYLANAWLMESVEPTRPDAAVIDPKSIAILPFSDISAATEDTEFLSFGIHDDFVTLLSGVRDLKVISRGSVRRFAGGDEDLGEIGATLGVGSVLVGSVRRAGDQVRVNVRLIDAMSGRQVWSGQYDREISVANIFAMQSDIVERITAELQGVLTPVERIRLADAPTTNLAAYEAYQIGGLRLAESTVSSITSAIEYFQRAAELNPDFALAYVGLAHCYLALEDYGNMPRDEAVSKSKRALRTALELDPDLGEAYAVLGGMMLRRPDENPDVVESTFRRALELAPNYGPAHHLYGQFLRIRGRYTESLAQHRAWVELDPLSEAANMGFGQILGAVGRNEESLFRLKKALEIRPDFIPAHQQLYWVYRENLGRLDQAVLHARRAASLDPESADYALMLAFTYLDLGDTELASQWAMRAAALDPEQFGTTPLMVQDERPAILELVQRKLDSGPGTDMHVDRMLHAWNAARYLMAAGRFEDARTLIERTDPSWFGDELPAIYWDNDWDATTVAFILSRTGDEERAGRLFDRILTWQWGATRTGIQGYHFGDAEIHALQGRKQQALAALRQAYLDGQRAGYWQIRADVPPWFDSIRDDPEFARITAAFESDFAVQRQRLREMENVGQLPAIAQ